MDAADVDVGGLVVDIPRDVEPAFRCVDEFLQGLAVDGVDGDALAGDDDADDAVSWQWMAAVGEMNGHAGDQAFDGNAAPAFVLALFSPRPGQRHDLVVVGLIAGSREDGFHHFAAGVMAGTDVGAQVVDFGVVEYLQDLAKCFVGNFVAFRHKGPVQHGAAQFHVFVALLQADEPAHPGPGLAGDHEPLPRRRRRLRLRGDDFDLVAVAKLAAERHHAAVDLRSNAVVADFRMDRVGEVDRSRAPWQVDQVAARRETKDLVLEHLELGVLQELLRSSGVLDDIQELAQPAVLGAFGLDGSLLIVPMPGQAVFGHVVHFGGADLHLDALAFGPENAGVQRLVAVRLRRRDVILKTVGDHRIGAVGDAQGAIAVLDRVDHHPEGHDVGKLLEADILVLHFVPHRIGGLFAP